MPIAVDAVNSAQDLPETTTPANVAGASGSTPSGESDTTVAGDLSPEEEVVVENAVQQMASMFMMQVFTMTSQETERIRANTERMLSEMHEE